MMNPSLFLDDEREPPDDGRVWITVRSYDEAVAWCEQHQFPDYVSFDNDLGDGTKEGWQFAQYLIDRDLERSDMPKHFAFTVHSMNPVRRIDIESRLKRYLCYKLNSCL